MEPRNDLDSKGKRNRTAVPKCAAAGKQPTEGTAPSLIKPAIGTNSRPLPRRPEAAREL
jgi:hypothetical protein